MYPGLLALAGDIGLCHYGPHGRIIDSEDIGGIGRSAETGLRKHRSVEGQATTSKREGQRGRAGGAHG